MEDKKLTYKDAGVDTKEGEREMCIRDRNRRELHP